MRTESVIPLMNVWVLSLGLETKRLVSIRRTMLKMRTATISANTNSTELSKTMGIQSWYLS